MNLSKKYLILSIVAVLLISVAGCTSEPPPPEPTSLPEPTTPPEPTATPMPTETPEPTATLEPTATTSPPDVPIPLDERSIIFISNRGDDPNHTNLYAVNPDGSDVRLIDTGFDFVANPAVSPDGNVIAFWSLDIGEELIHTINIDGTGLKQITDFNSAMPDWSPDGDRLVFQSDHQNEPKDTPDIYITDISGENLVEILDDPEIIDYAPKWSSDGESILFVTHRTGKSELFIMDLEGNATQVTYSEDPVIYGALSPDGQKVAFQYGGFGVTDLYVMNLDGSDFLRLTTEHTNSNPAWSPDGTQIVFSSDRGEFWDLWIINIDGSGLTQLTNDVFWDGAPDW